ncbi:hypothetical protein OU995_16640 [Roseateles sp. SL47]|uniref:hypothetical protein n=1 Tax=Roseateles sp. SL47 TaxID=2995138 RepID=UPI0022704753|nr:hypothetical protein [Roseateles sp. SL47]WAC71217.1 hypothetical protein OU995_16640 [Roseateles sp. SL47]
MSAEIDWEAAVEPGHRMLGLTLGMDFSSVRALLGPAGAEVQFRGSPLLIVDDQQEGAIHLRAVDLLGLPYEWQNSLVRLVFSDGRLVTITADGMMGNEFYAYRGKFKGKVGLGSKVSELQEFGTFEFDDAEEVFFSDGWKGMEVSGSNACDLEKSPDQTITFMKVWCR